MFSYKNNRLSVNVFSLNDTTKYQKLAFLDGLFASRLAKGLMRQTGNSVKIAGNECRSTDQSELKPVCLRI